MRAFPWLVALACVALVVVPTSLFAQAQEPRAPAEAARDEGQQLQMWTGQSVVHFKGACLEGLPRCVGGAEREDGAFFLAAPASMATIVVSWRPVNDSMRVLRASVAGVEAVGESPLRVELPGLDAGEHAVRVEPAARTIRGVFDQTVDWVATVSVGLPLERVDMHGRSGYEATGACVLGTCTPLVKRTSDTVVVPWMAHGTLDADWDARAGSMRVALRGTDVAIEGAPPLKLELGGLAPGEYAIDVTPTLVAPPASAREIQWHVVLDPDA